MTPEEELLLREDAPIDGGALEGDPALMTMTGAPAGDPAAMQRMAAAPGGGQMRGMGPFMSHPMVARLMQASEAARAQRGAAMDQRQAGGFAGSPMGQMMAQRFGPGQARAMQGGPPGGGAPPQPAASAQQPGVRAGGRDGAPGQQRRQMAPQRQQAPGPQPMMQRQPSWGGGANAGIQQALRARAGGGRLV